MPSSLRGLCVALLWSVALCHPENTEWASGDSGDASKRQMRLETKEQRHVQIGAHGSFALAEGSTSSDANLTTAEKRSLTEQKAKKRSGGPKLTGYENSDCGGTSLGSYVLPTGADFTGDHCVAIRNADTDAPAGRIKISCDGSGVAKACIWHDPKDTSCELAEPFCLNIQAIDTALVAGGSCIPVKEHPVEKDTFARFSDFPEDTKWPDCLVPPMSMSMMLIVVMGGVSSGSIILCCIWYCFLAVPSHQKHMDDHWGKGKGKGWGEQHHEPHPSGAVDADGNPLPANLPGVPALKEAPSTTSLGSKGPMPGKGMPDPNMMKGGFKGPDMMKGPPGGFKGFDPNMMKGDPNKGMMKGGWGKH